MGILGKIGGKLLGKVIQRGAKTAATSAAKKGAKRLGARAGMRAARLGLRKAGSAAGRLGRRAGSAAVGQLKDSGNQKKAGEAALNWAKQKYSPTTPGAAPVPARAQNVMQPLPPSAAGGGYTHQWNPAQPSDQDFEQVVKHSIQRHRRSSGARGSKKHRKAIVAKEMAKWV